MTPSNNTFQVSANTQAVVDQHPHLALSRSSELYPDASGDGLPLIVVNSPSCKALIAVQGAQLLAFEAKDQAPLLWLSPRTHFQTGKAIRGGIPLCAPWFGPHDTDQTKPQHGYARNNDWSLLSARDSEAGLKLLFQLNSNEALLKLHPWALRLKLEMILSDSLSIKFSVHNCETPQTEPRPMPFSWALHSYFPVTHIRDTRVVNLPHTLSFDGEVDRMETSVPSEQSIQQEGLPRKLMIRGEQCPSAIVWNPGEVLAATMADLGAENFAQFVCVERGAAGENTWMIGPGETREAKVKFWWQTG